MVKSADSYQEGVAVTDRRLYKCRGCASYTDGHFPLLSDGNALERSPLLLSNVVGLCFTVLPIMHPFELD
jgi:hypothetical protein